MSGRDCSRRVGSEPSRKLEGLSTFNETEDYKGNWRGARKVGENHQR